MTFADLAKDLSDFETFDEKLFVADAIYSQDLCNFILALALAYNDFRDVFTAHLLLSEIGNIPEQPKTPMLGLRNGLRNSLIRVQIGFVHEILKLIEENSKVISDPSFRKVIFKLNRDGKIAWSTLTSVIFNRDSKDPIVKALVMIRNKVAFHYDAAEIGKSYMASFVTHKHYGPPLVSRGGTLKSTRFYFADAISQHYLMGKAIDPSVLDFINGDGDFLLKLNRSLYQIVITYIQMRSGLIKVI